MNDPVITRLAAANPFPAPTAPTPARTPGRPRRRVLAAALAATAIGVPAAAFANDIGGLLGFSTQGQPFAAGDTPFARVTALNAALHDLGFPSTMELIARREGVSFYAARRSDGTFCFAVDSGGTRQGVGCDNGSPAGAAFPSPQRPIIDLSRFSGGRRLVGFAADGVASVALIDASGATIASAPVVDNVYADLSPPAGAAGVTALDANGTVVYRRTFDEAP